MTLQYVTDIVTVQQNTNIHKVCIITLPFCKYCQDFTQSFTYESDQLAESLSTDHSRLVTDSYIDQGRSELKQLQKYKVSLH